MSSSTDLILPPEVLNLIIDHLHTEPGPLKSYSLVSKSWVPRTRRHLFGHVEFDSDYGPFLESWMDHFPDPSTSPAHHARVLAFRAYPVIAANATAIISHLRSFCHITRLEVGTSGWNDHRLSFVPLHGLSPTLKSLSLHYELVPLSEILNLICSFPLLEDLALSHYGLYGHSGWRDIPSTSPKLSGTLELDSEHPSITRGLLSLPNGLHFSKITLLRSVEDAELTMEVVSECSDTLESLSIRYSHWHGTPVPPAFDLSVYPKLKAVEFHGGSVSIGWIITTLQSGKPKSLQRVVVHVYGISSYEAGEMGHEWRDLDHLLSRLWTSHSILPKVTCGSRLEREVARRLLPELANRGVVYDHR